MYMQSECYMLCIVFEMKTKGTIEHNLKTINGSVIMSHLIEHGIPHISPIEVDVGL